MLRQLSIFFSISPEDNLWNVGMIECAWNMGMVAWSFGFNDGKEKKWKID